jgi:Type I phosphodiesterase / nucleotide pyrophosphatase
MADRSARDGAAEAAQRPVTPAWPRQGRLYVIGVDGMSLDVASPMMERGELPAFARLARDGCHGPLATVQPTNSALLWASIATGRHYRDHGVDGFDYYTILGRRLTHTAILKYRRRGIRVLESVARALRLRKRHYFDGRHVRTKTFWDIVSECGGRVGVVNWWLTWPAAPVNGFIISDRLHYWRRAWLGRAVVETRLTYPEGLLEEVRELMAPPEQITPAELQRFIDLPADEIQALTDVPRGAHNPAIEVRFLLSKDSANSRVFHHCLDSEPETQLAVAYFRAPDNAQHCGFAYLPTSTASDATPEERKAFGRIVPEGYKFADELLGRVVDRMGPQDTLLALSDHGFGAQPGYRHPYGHAKGEPPGVIFAMGPEFRSGERVRDASIYDLFPTALRVMGFPPAQDSVGRCLEELLRPEWRALHPPLEPIPTYGLRLPRHDTIWRSSDAEKALTDDLRALGYLE